MVSFNLCDLNASIDRNPRGEPVRWSASFQIGLSFLKEQSIESSQLYSTLRWLTMLMMKWIQTQLLLGVFFSALITSGAIDDCSKAIADLLEMLNKDRFSSVRVIHAIPMPVLCKPILKQPKSKHATSTKFDQPETCNQDSSVEQPPSNPETLQFGKADSEIEEKIELICSLYAKIQQFKRSSELERSDIKGNLHDHPTVCPGAEMSKINTLEAKESPDANCHSFTLNHPDEDCLVSLCSLKRSAGFVSSKPPYVGRGGFGSTPNLSKIVVQNFKSYKAHRSPVKQFRPQGAGHHKASPGIARKLKSSKRVPETAQRFMDPYREVLEYYETPPALRTTGFHDRGGEASLIRRQPSRQKVGPYQNQHTPQPAEPPAYYDPAFSRRQPYQGPSYLNPYEYPQEPNQMWQRPEYEENAYRTNPKIPAKSLQRSPSDEMPKKDVKPAEPPKLDSPKIPKPPTEEEGEAPLQLVPLPNSKKPAKTSITPKANTSDLLVHYVKSFLQKCGVKLPKPDSLCDLLQQLLESCKMKMSPSGLKQPTIKPTRSATGDEDRFGLPDEEDQGRPNSLKNGGEQSVDEPSSRFDPGNEQSFPKEAGRVPKLVTEQEHILINERTPVREDVANPPSKGVPTPRMIKEPKPFPIKEDAPGKRDDPPTIVKESTPFPIEEAAPEKRNDSSPRLVKEPTPFPIKEAAPGKRDDPTPALVMDSDHIPISKTVPKRRDPQNLPENDVPSPALIMDSDHIPINEAAPNRSGPPTTPKDEPSPTLTMEPTPILIKDPPTKDVPDPTLVGQPPPISINETTTSKEKPNSPEKEEPAPPKKTTPFSPPRIETIPEPSKEPATNEILPTLKKPKSDDQSPQLVLQPSHLSINDRPLKEPPNPFTVKEVPVNMQIVGTYNETTGDKSQAKPSTHVAPEDVFEMLFGCNRTVKVVCTKPSSSEEKPHYFFISSLNISNLMPELYIFNRTYNSSSSCCPRIILKTRAFCGPKIICQSIEQQGCHPSFAKYFQPQAVQTCVNNGNVYCCNK